MSGRIVDSEEGAFGCTAVQIMEQNLDVAMTVSLLVCRIRVVEFRDIHRSQLRRPLGESFANGGSLSEEWKDMCTEDIGLRRRTR